MFKKKIGIITPWFGRFAGGAERLAKGMARELNKRGIHTIVFTTCSLSPYDSWWTDHYEQGTHDVDGIETLRFSTGRIREPYDAVIRKLSRGSALSVDEQKDFFTYGINSAGLVQAIDHYVNADYELIALPYFHGLTHSVLDEYPGRISLIPCFHDEPQFHWEATEQLLRNSKHVFFNAQEEKQLTITHYGRRVGRRIVESVVTGVGVELPAGSGVSEETAEGLPSSYFVYAGRKERGKNVHLLCEWFLEYARKFGGNTKLVLMGGGDESLVPSHDCFLDLGFVSEEKKLDIFRNSKGIVNLSENESFSIVIMEGWLCGVPSVVSARCAVTRGHVSRGNGGLFVSNKDEFSRALKFIEDNETVRDRLAANGRRYLAREFSFDVVLSRYLAELNRDS
jgi:glycosyltransferase involved in cell wall biosynthesis